MELINELELRRLLLREENQDDLVQQLLKNFNDSTVPWEEKRPLFYFLFQSGRHATLARVFIEALRANSRVPFDLVIVLCQAAKIEPKALATEALVKGIKKHKSLEEVLTTHAWDELNEQIPKLRRLVLEEKLKNLHRFKDEMMEKFNFLREQRMTNEAYRVLRRMIELYPEDKELQAFQKDFEEVKAREVLANHFSQSPVERWERSAPASAADLEMLECWLREGEKLASAHPAFAFDVAVAFYFMEDFDRALQILILAPENSSSDWLKAELLFSARRFVETLEHLNQLELKYVSDPESTFAVSYLRAQTLNALGQQAPALEILKGILNIRPNYRSAHALVLEWTKGTGWS